MRVLRSRVRYRIVERRDGSFTIYQKEGLNSEPVGAFRTYQKALDWRETLPKGTTVTWERLPGR